MPYRFIVSSKTDYVEATSYINLEDADIIADVLPNKGLWDNLDDEKRKILLISASLGIDGLDQYQGLPTDPDQILKFPRNGKESIPLGLDFAVVKFAVRLSQDLEFREVKKEVTPEIEKEYFQNTLATSEIKKDPDVIIFLNKYKARTVSFKII